MQMLIDIQSPFPPGVDQSYIPFGFYKFGLCCWVYEGGYDGAIEWINTQHFVTEPKYQNPVSFRYCFLGGTIGTVTPKLVVNTSVPDITINTKVVNMATGKEIP